MEFLLWLSKELSKHCQSIDLSVDKVSGKPRSGMEDNFLVSLTCAKQLIEVMRQYASSVHNNNNKHLVESSINSALLQVPDTYVKFLRGK